LKKQNKIEREASLIKSTGLEMDLINRSKWVAIIGSREGSAKELNAAYNLAKTCVNKGYIVVSGLAKGIDAYAHRGAIESGGNTIAIVNTPIEQAIYPKENQRLAEDIRKVGCIIHPFDTYAREDKAEKPSHFTKRLLERDRLLAWLCPVIVAVKDAEIVTGGTRYAVKYGLEYGKKVFRYDSNMQFHEEPHHEKCNIWWDMELNLNSFK
jgi:DNA processing protein